MGNHAAWLLRVYVGPGRSEAWQPRAGQGPVRSVFGADQVAAAALLELAGRPQMHAHINRESRAGRAARAQRARRNLKAGRRAREGRAGGVASWRPCTRQRVKASAPT